ncbi:MAG: amidohydrolase [Selenomonadaceae bacterium]|nr:amidohydrolase [Selenomonadaceae bacterium]
MIIDIHTHIFPNKISASTLEKLSGISHSTPFTDGTLDGLLQSMKKFHVDISVILPVATKPEQVIKINDNAAQINEKYFDADKKYFNADEKHLDAGIISFASIHPDFEDFRAELSRVKNLGFKGIKIHPVYQGTNLDDKKFLRIIYRAAELDLIVITHAGLDIGFPGKINCTPKMSRHVVKEIGEFKFILAHMGGWKNWDEVAEELADLNIFIDTAFSTGLIPAKDNYYSEEELKMLDAAGFMRLYEIFGAEKILFGTDSPWMAQGMPIDFINRLPIGDADKNKIFGSNAAKLLNLK